ncbi:MAG: hypothetical protein HYS86_03720, partial [Candidatus Chisholmbacteria bacterium]|nr:hypothetical protein [Candidatus Chisholmbacteria bacterium]
MVWPLKEILYVISGFVSLVVALNHLYWWQTKEYRLDRMLTWAIYDRGFKELLSLKSRRP